MPNLITHNQRYSDINTSIQQTNQPSGLINFTNGWRRGRTPAQPHRVEMRGWCLNCMVQNKSIIPLKSVQFAASSCEEYLPLVARQSRFANPPLSRAPTTCAANWPPNQWFSTGWFQSVIRVICKLFKNCSSKTHVRICGKFCENPFSERTTKMSKLSNRLNLVLQTEHISLTIFSSPRPQSQSTVIYTHTWSSLTNAL